MITLKEMQEFVSEYVSKHNLDFVEVIIDSDGSITEYACAEMDSHRIVINSIILSILNKSEIITVLAHELGHLYPGAVIDYYDHETEYYADRKALEFDRSPDVLITLLMKLYTRDGGSVSEALKISSVSHPSINLRWFNLKYTSKNIFKKKSMSLFEQLFNRTGSYE